MVKTSTKGKNKYFIYLNSYVFDWQTKYIKSRWYMPCPRHCALYLYIVYSEHPDPFLVTSLPFYRIPPHQSHHPDRHGKPKWAYPCLSNAHRAMVPYRILRPWLQTFPGIALPVPKRHFLPYSNLSSKFYSCQLYWHRLRNPTI